MRQATRPVRSMPEGAAFSVNRNAWRSLRHYFFSFGSGFLRKAKPIEPIVTKIKPATISQCGYSIAPVLIVFILNMRARVDTWERAAFSRSEGQLCASPSLDRVEWQAYRTGGGSPAHCDPIVSRSRRDAPPNLLSPARSSHAVWCRVQANVLLPPFIIFPLPSAPP